MAEAWITTDDLGAYLRREIDPYNDILAQAAIDGACDRIRSETGQQIDGVVDDVVTLDGTGQDTLILPELPVVDVTSVQLWQPDGCPPLDIDSDDWFARLGRRGQIVRRGSWSAYGIWLRGRGLYLVTYSHGYDTPGAGLGSGVVFPALPGDLKTLAITLAARMYDQGLVSQETVGTAYQVIYSAASSLALTAGEMAIINKYSAGYKPAG